MNWFKALHPIWYMEADKGDGSGDKSQGDESEKKETVIDWTKIDVSLIPEDLVKKHPTFTKVKDEAANRRIENTNLKKSIKQLGTDEEAQEDKKPVDEKKVTQEEEIPAWAKQILDKFNTLETGNLDSWKQEAANEFGIKSKSVIKTLEGKTKDEVFASAKTIADELGIPKPAPSLTNPKISVGNPTQQRDKTVLEQAKARMRGDQSASIFDPKVQESLGGGIQLND